MRYLLAFFVLWFVFFTMRKIGRGIICLILQLTVIGWLPATIWALTSISNYYDDRRTDRIVSAIHATHEQPAAEPRRI
jgi:hypothetical protein